MKNIWKIGSPATNQDCSAVHGNKSTDVDGWRCYMAEYISPYVKTPIFDAEAMYDAWMLPNILELGCKWYGAAMPGQCNGAQVKAFQEWGSSANSTVATELLRTTTAAGIPLRRGVFLSACIHHCQSMYMCGASDGQDRYESACFLGNSRLAGCCCLHN